MAEVRYCTTEDGVRIAYALEGHGPPLLVVPLFVESFSLERMAPELEAFTRLLGEGRQLVRYDTRGTGLSQRDVADLSHDALVRDLEAVVRAAGLQRFSLWAQTIGGPRAIDYSAHHPAQMSHLILYGTYAQPKDVMPPENIQGLVAMTRGDWALAAQLLADIAGRRDFPEAMVAFADVYRESASGEVAARLIETAYTSDVTNLLSAVKAETLVIHRLSDPLFPFAAGQSLAAQIPQGRFVPLEGRVHTSALGDSQSILDAVNAFLKEEQVGEPSDADEAVGVGGFRTILFTDVVGHTAMMQRLGDVAGRQVLREHERITRDVLKRHGGSEVKTMGDGFMASFFSATRALECAIAMQRAFAEHNESAEEPMRVRIGLNAGEPIAEEEDLFGMAVILAARIAAKAEGGEILASEAVRQIVAGKRFPFSDRGQTALRGFEDRVHIYQVSWREA